MPITRVTGGKRRRRRKLGALTAVIALVAVAGIGLFAYNSSTSDASSTMPNDTILENAQETLENLEEHNTTAVTNTTDTGNFPKEFIENIEETGESPINEPTEDGHQDRWVSIPGILNNPQRLYVYEPASRLSNLGDLKDMDINLDTAVNESKLSITVNLWQENQYEQSLGLITTGTRQTVSHKDSALYERESGLSPSGNFVHPAYNSVPLTWFNDSIHMQYYAVSIYLNDDVEPTMIAYLMDSDFRSTSWYEYKTPEIEGYPDGDPENWTFPEGFDFEVPDRKTGEVADVTDISVIITNTDGDKWFVLDDSKWDTSASSFNLDIPASLFDKLPVWELESVISASAHFVNVEYVITTDQNSGEQSYLVQSIVWDSFPDDAPLPLYFATGSQMIYMVLGAVVIIAVVGYQISGKKEEDEFDCPPGTDWDGNQCVVNP